MMLKRLPTFAGRFVVPLATLVCSLSFQTATLSEAEASVETRYVRPTAEVVVRRGQGTEYKIVGMVKNGDSVDILEESGSYARIRFGDKEGWMLKRYLSAEPPMGEIVASLRKERDELQRENAEATEQAQMASAELSKIRADLDVVLAEREKIVRDYQLLMSDAANVVQTKNDLQRVSAENEQLQQRVGVLAEDNKELKKKTAINWFLAGAGVLLVGILIGRLPSPSRRRKSSLL